MVETMTKRKIPGRINEEHVCIDSFIQHLREIDNKQEITFDEEPNDPPDFWVTITGTKYAVEVTSITDYGYEALCNKSFKDIRSEFAAGNIINGTYLLYVIGRPSIPKKGTTEWKKLIATIAINVQDTSNTLHRPEHYILADKNGRIGITKLSDQGAKIHISMTGAKWGGEIQEELSKLIKERIEAKQEQLGKKSVLHQYPIILLFYDAYGYAEVEDTRKAFLNVQGYEWLHSIFLTASFSDTQNTLYPASPGRKGLFLYTKNEQWR